MNICCFVLFTGDLMFPKHLHGESAHPADQAAASTREGDQILQALRCLGARAVSQFGVSVNSERPLRNGPRTTDETQTDEKKKKNVRSLNRIRSALLIEFGRSKSPIRPIGTLLNCFFYLGGYYFLGSSRLMSLAWPVDSSLIWPRPCNPSSLQVRHEHGRTKVLSYQFGASRSKE